ncbi:putative ribosomal N-acetyltransferase YdaF [Andreprevotia sp. IGB-42]|uniref:GNAT family N-acetyltransferase n=1 Tax=Andreprevotia sp. IGB-42 TaxID=2497473 RepID=UPI00135C0C2D|nr:GNAT family protein [Andreprevotia sp. IGB-42]KAF0811441.1 putative ribosomal N-acetyltransferase YdaF [Andreprevotia sp. IGB-42]
MPTAPPFPTLLTDRLVLREIVASDAPALLAIHGDAAQMRWFGAIPLPGITAAEQLVHTFASWRLLPNPGTRWGIQPLGSDTLIGSCGLFNWNRAWHKCTVGYELGAAAQGQGYMREALRAALRWGFAHMALNRIEAQIHPANLPSLKLAQALGFATEGCLREGGYWNDQYHDLLQLALLRSDELRGNAMKMALPQSILLGMQ